MFIESLVLNEFSNTLAITFGELNMIVALSAGTGKSLTVRLMRRQGALSLSCGRAPARAMFNWHKFCMLPVFTCAQVNTENEIREERIEFGRHARSPFRRAWPAADRLARQPAAKLSLTCALALPDWAIYIGFSLSGNVLINMQAID